MPQPKIVITRPKQKNDGIQQDRSPRVIIRSLIHDLDLDSYALELRFWKIDGAEEH
jgi:hypothetical protein